MSIYKIIIPGNTPSLKNSKQIITVKGTGKKYIVPSETYEKWKPAALKALYEPPNDQLRLKEWRYPLRISFHFIRNAHGRFDYINIAQGPLDLLVETKIIEDDDSLHVIPGDFSHQYQPDAACCILTVEEWGEIRTQWGESYLKASQQVIQT